MQQIELVQCCPQQSADDAHAACAFMQHVPPAPAQLWSLQQSALDMQLLAVFTHGGPDPVEDVDPLVVEPVEDVDPLVVPVIVPVDVAPPTPAVVVPVVVVAMVPFDVLVAIAPELALPLAPPALVDEPPLLQPASAATKPPSPNAPTTQPTLGKERSDLQERAALVMMPERREALRMPSIEILLPRPRARRMPAASGAGAGRRIVVAVNGMYGEQGRRSRRQEVIAAIIPPGVIAAIIPPGVIGRITAGGNAADRRRALRGHGRVRFRAGEV
jgi:hypothetical protein